RGRHRYRVETGIYARSEVRTSQHRVLQEAIWRTMQRYLSECVYPKRNQIPFSAIPYPGAEGRRAETGHTVFRPNGLHDEMRHSEKSEGHGCARCPFRVIEPELFERTPSGGRDAGGMRGDWKNSYKSAHASRRGRWCGFSE